MKGHPQHNLVHWDEDVHLDIICMLLICHPVMMDDLTQWLHVDAKKDQREHQALQHITNKWLTSRPLTFYQHLLGPAMDISS